MQVKNNRFQIKDSIKIATWDVRGLETKED